MGSRGQAAIQRAAADGARKVIPEMSFRYMLRLENGSDAGEVEFERPANVVDEIRVTENLRARVRPWFRSTVVEEFVATIRSTVPRGRMVRGKSREAPSPGDYFGSWIGMRPE